MQSRVVRFLLVGIANTVVGLGIIYLLKWAGGVDDVPANFAGYMVGLCVSFVLNRNWTFRHRGSVLPAALRFLCVFAVAYSVNLLVMLGLRDGLHLNSYLCHLLSQLPYTVVFFLGSKLFAFRSAAEQTSPLDDAGLPENQSLTPTRSPQ